MPVHRHVHEKRGSIYAFRSELDEWAHSRHGSQVVDSAPAAEQPPEGAPPQTVNPAAVPPPPPGTRRLNVWTLATGVLLLVSGFAAWQLGRDRSFALLTGARFQQLTDFAGNAHAAALSRDGRLVSFLSDRAGQMDVWVTQPGTGKFYNLTQGSEKDIVNPSLRNLGFTPDGSLVTYWRRVVDPTGTHISIWAAPVLGGPPRPHLEGVAEFDWTADGARLVYHTPGPGDPMFVRDKEQTAARAIFTAPAGRHSHFPVWAPDQSFVYFVDSLEGAVPERMDIWRIRPTGGTPERITHHDSRVTHPVFVDARTLAYLASDADGSGPWLHTLDVKRRVPHRIRVGLESYTSLAASTDGRRLVAALTRRQETFWRFPITDTPTTLSTARRIPLTTGSGSAPRLGPGYLLYVSSKGESDSIWKLQGEVATELWSAPGTRIIGPPAVDRDGRRIAFSTRRNRQTSLLVANVDGTGTRIVTSSLDLQGAPAWAPEGQSITIASTVDGTPRLFNVPLDGSAPSPLVFEHSTDAAWSDDGAVAVYSGPDVGTTFPLKAVTATGEASSLPSVTLTRGARHVAFLPGGRTLAVLRGEMGHKNLWLIDLTTGAGRQLTDFGPDFTVRDFDISPDGREVVVEQVQQQSDLVLIDLPRR
ncbi:MAG: PD40 domain-containing protein [Acidobacteria bacterium]|nr:PD40 domain-containing protein [Acidobacteriota bacterium]